MKHHQKTQNCPETRASSRSAWMSRPSLTDQLRSATAHVGLDLRSILVFCGPALCWLSSTGVFLAELIQPQTAGDFGARKKSNDSMTNPHITNRAWGHCNSFLLGCPVQLASGSESSLPAGTGHPAARPTPLFVAQDWPPVGTEGCRFFRPVGRKNSPWEQPSAELVDAAWLRWER